MAEMGVFGKGVFVETANVSDDLSIPGELVYRWDAGGNSFCGGTSVTLFLERASVDFSNGTHGDLSAAGVPVEDAGQAAQALGLPLPTNFTAVAQESAYYSFAQQGVLSKEYEQDPEAIREMIRQRINHPEELDSKTGVVPGKNGVGKVRSRIVGSRPMVQAHYQAAKHVDVDFSYSAGVMRLGEEGKRRVFYEVKTGPFGGNNDEERFYEGWVDVFSAIPEADQIQRETKLKG